LPAGMAVGMDGAAGLVTAAAGRLADAATFDLAGGSLALSPSYSAPVFAGGRAERSSTESRPLVIENMHIHGVLDFSEPSSARRTVERLRQELRNLERERYSD